MKALVFAAGLGTRLRPLTNDRPKALVEVGGRTMLEHVITHLASAGVDDITINIHHFGEKIIEFLAKKSNFGLNIHISDERDLLLDTGGGLLKARPFLDGDEPFIVHNADVLTDLDLKAMYEFHVAHQALSTILVKPRQTQRYFLFNPECRLRGWVNKATGETKPSGYVYNPTQVEALAFGCVHVISPTIFDALEKYSVQKGKVFSIAPFYAEMCHQYEFYGYQQKEDYKWLDVGKPETLAQAAEMFP